MIDYPNKMFEQAYEAGQTLGRDIVTTMILEERGDADPQVIANRHDLIKQYEDSIRKMTQLAIRMQDQEGND